MSDDKELLERAATATGVKWRWFGATFCTEHDPEMGTYRPWSPLTDDGDALRLAVKLASTTRLNFTIGSDLLRASADPCADVRRAIVQIAAAAAKVGDGKDETP